MCCSLRWFSAQTSLKWPMWEVGRGQPAMIPVRINPTSQLKYSCINDIFILTMTWRSSSSFQLFSDQNIFPFSLQDISSLIPMITDVSRDLWPKLSLIYSHSVVSISDWFSEFTLWNLGAISMKRVAAGAYLSNSWLFEPAKRPDDRADYWLDCSFLH